MSEHVDDLSQPFLSTYDIRKTPSLEAVAPFSSFEASMARLILKSSILLFALGQCLSNGSVVGDLCVVAYSPPCPIKCRIHSESHSSCV